MPERSKGTSGSSSSKSLAAVVTAVLGDLATVFGIPAGTGMQLMRNYINNRAREACEILFEEIGRAKIDEIEAASQDEKIEIIYRYGLAVREGAARRNLRLLAKVIAGLGRRDRLYAEEFNMFAECLSRLTRDEIVVVGTLHRFRKAEEKRQGKGVSTHQWWTKAVNELVPASFASEEHVIAICCSALRTGLIITPRDFDSTGEYATSPIMDEVAELVDFHDVFRDEAV